MVYQNRGIIGFLVIKFLLMEFSIFVQKRHFYHSTIDRKSLNGDFSANEVIGNIFPIFPNTKITLRTFAKRGYDSEIGGFDHADPERVFPAYYFPAERNVELSDGFEFRSAVFPFLIRNSKIQLAMFQKNDFPLEAENFSYQEMPVAPLLERLVP